MRSSLKILSLKLVVGSLSSQMIIGTPEKNLKAI
jgi:hypothetical protein